MQSYNIRCTVTLLYSCWAVPFWCSSLPKQRCKRESHQGRYFSAGERAIVRERRRGRRGQTVKEPSSKEKWRPRIGRRTSIRKFKNKRPKAQRRDERRATLVESTTKSVLRSFDALLAHAPDGDEDIAGGLVNGPSAHRMAVLEGGELDAPNRPRDGSAWEVAETPCVEVLLCCRTLVLMVR